jgi:hypothetical protein
VLALVILLAIECPNTLSQCEEELIGDEDDFEEK